MEPRPLMRQSGVVIGPRSGRTGYRDDREDVTGDIEPPKLLDQGRQRLRVKHYSLRRSEEHTSELQSLMRISYAVFCLTTNKNANIYVQRNIYSTIPRT